MNKGCSLWTGAVNSKGYGTRSVKGRQWLAHRFAYVEAFGSIPDGMQLHHTCGERLCINPTHLEPVSSLEHNRAHLDGPSGGQIIEAAFRLFDEISYRDLVAHAARQGVSEGAISSALHRAGWLERVAHGIYSRKAANA